MLYRDSGKKFKGGGYQIEIISHQAKAGIRVESADDGILIGKHDIPPIINNRVIFCKPILKKFMGHDYWLLLKNVL